ncbi:hypothetical protein SEEM038_21368, partial [Salmonella enterica subsp. enterica serovar Senftenberg str. NC_MB012510-0038]
WLAVIMPWYTPVYPRWRGEHIDSTGNGLIEIGLSPLARGTLGKNAARYY